MVIHDSGDGWPPIGAAENFFCYLGQKYLIHIVDFSNIVER